MSIQNFGRISPFRAPLIRDDIGVNRSNSKNLDRILLDAEKIGNNLLQKSSRTNDSPNHDFLTDKAIHRSNITTPIESNLKFSESEDTEQKRLKHIEELTEELNLNRKRYEKLLSDHAEEKRHWMTYIKQLEAERDRSNFSSKSYE